MDTGKIIIVIVLLLVMALVLYLCLSKKSYKPFEHVSPDRIPDIIRSLLSDNIKAINQDNFNCFSAELLNKIDFINQNKTQRLESILGIKGNWSNCLKKQFLNYFKIMSIDMPKSMCIIGKMEQQYSPSEINNMSNDKFRDILYNIVVSC